MVEGALELGIDWLTVYAFSTENWKRPADEVRYLMGFNEGILKRHRDKLDEWGVRIRFLGRRDWRVPRRLLRRIDEAEAQTPATADDLRRRVQLRRPGRDHRRRPGARGRGARPTTSPRRPSRPTCTTRPCPTPTS